MEAENKILEELKIIYQENVGWLNFAELKNGALITVTGVILGLTDATENIWIVLLCLAIMLLSGISFVPFLNNSKKIRELVKEYYDWTNAKECKDTDNVIFYLGIFLSSKMDYIGVLKKVIAEDANYSLTKLEKNYVEQIYQISSIASIKYFLFTIAFLLFVIMLIVFGIGLVL